MIPAGISFSWVCETEVTCAFAVRMSAVGWKKILTTPKPAYETPSMCSISFTVVVSARSNGVMMRPFIWSGGRPVYCHTTLITGI